MHLFSEWSIDCKGFLSHVMWDKLCVWQILSEGLLSPLAKEELMITTEIRSHDPPIMTSFWSQFLALIYSSEFPVFFTPPVVLYLLSIYYNTGADPGFPVGGVDPFWGGVDLRRGTFW